MRMKNRFCRMGKMLLGAACLLSTCGITYSCSDDYDLDETSPSFLGQSIYNELKSRGKYTTVIRLIDDLGYSDVLAKTGSKTLFVADDDAYTTFFANNSWGVSKYEDLSSAQKKILLYGSMLNNAYVLEMLSTIQGPVKNLCLRQESSLAALDSVPYFKWNELPTNLNNPDNPKTTADNQYWKNYATQEKGGIYLALDKTDPLMTHFLQAQLNEKSITSSDISFILGLDGTDKAWNDSKNRSFVYDAEIKEQDVTCMNGYFHVLDKVLVTPSNMAEVIRTNSDTHLFSILLERFSAPYYDATFTNNFKQNYETLAVDSVYQKLYIAQRGQTGNVTTDPSGKTIASDAARLTYDPGWNQYKVDNTTKEEDMAAMFVPSDEAMKTYFLRGVGATLIETYSDKPTHDESTLEYDLCQIPLNIVVKLINNLMKESFNATVPSKYQTVMNSAQDQMFSSYADLASFKKAIKKVMLANNGVVYVMNDFITPPDYAAVSGPVLTGEGVKIMNSIIHADDNYVTNNYSNAPLRKFYSTYLLAMQSHFSLFVPTDEALGHYLYIDPLIYALDGGNTGNVSWSMSPADIGKTSGAVIGVATQGYFANLGNPLDVDHQRSKGTTYVSKADDNLNSSAKYGQNKKQMLIDLVDQHILVHGDTNGDGEMITTDRKYYLSRGGAPIIVQNFGSDLSTGKGLVVEGAFQHANNESDSRSETMSCEVTKGFDLSQGYGNGHTYFLNRAMQPALDNVYQVLTSLKSSEKGYSKFFDACKELEYGSNSETFEKIFRTQSSTGGWSMLDADWKTEQQKFAIFATNTETTASGNNRFTAVGTNLVRFFNNYRYTVFVPSDAAMEKAYQEGLPTMEEINQYVDANCQASEVDGNTLYTWRPGTQAIAKAKVTCLVNFLKYHFCDQSYFVDSFTDAAGDENFSQTACVDSVSNTFIPLAIKHVNGGLQVYDVRSMNSSRDKVARANEYSSVSTAAGTHNLMARDYELNAFAKANNNNNVAKSIKSSSYVSLQGLNGQNFLLFSSDLDGDFTKAWTDESKANAFVKRFKLHK